MKYKRFFMPAFIIFFVSLLFPMQAVNAAQDKYILTTIQDFHLYSQGVVFSCNDEEEYLEYLEVTKMYLSYLPALTDDRAHYAELMLESFDSSEVNLYTPGCYQIHVKLKLSEEYRNDFYAGEELLNFNIPVYVPDSSRFELFLKTDSWFGWIYEWYPPAYTMERQVLYVCAPASSPLTEQELASASWNTWTDDALAHTSYNTLDISRPLPDDRIYYFRVKIEEKLSDVIYVSNTMKASPIGIFTGGNRDGSDREEDLPPLVQPAPEIPSSEDDSHDQETSYGIAAPADSYSSSFRSPDSNSKTSGKSSPTPVTETVTDTKTTLSGARIHMLIKQEGQNIPFAWNGMCLHISKDYFKNLNLKDDDLFSVEMIKPDSHSFTLSITCNGKKLSSIPSFYFQFFLEDKAASFILFLNGQKLDTPITYENNYASFTLDRTGNYEIKEDKDILKTTDEYTKEVSDTSDIKKKSWKIPVSAGAVLVVLILVFIIFFGLRKERK